MTNSDMHRVTQLLASRAAGLALYARQWVDAATAEDVVQEALTALLTQRRLPNDPVAWMARAVRNAAIDHARSASRRRRREQAVAQDRREWFLASADARLDGQTAEQALQTLPAELREIVVLRIWGQMGFAQIAQAVQLSVSTVHDRYVSALAQLRIALEKPCKSPTD
jgi:RNA polymerase sigma-70 factor (ECF subfamily)